MLMPLDSFALFVVAICTLILFTEDGIYPPWVRFVLLGISGICLWYSLWLLSSWSPGPAGFPWQRAAIDGLIMIERVWRVVVVLIALRRNSGRLFAPYAFGVTKR